MLENTNPSSLVPSHSSLCSATFPCSTSLSLNLNLCLFLNCVQKMTKFLLFPQRPKFWQNLDAGAHAEHCPKLHLLTHFKPYHWNKPHKALGGSEEWELAKTLPMCFPLQCFLFSLRQSVFAADLEKWREVRPVCCLSGPRVLCSSRLKLTQWEGSLCLFSKQFHRVVASDLRGGGKGGGGERG